MDHLKSILAVELADPFRPFSELRAIVRFLAGDAGAELQGAPLTAQAKDRGEQTTLLFRGIRFEQERASSPASAVERATSVVTALSAVTPVPAIESARYDSIFIRPFELPFHELVTLIKQKYFGSSTTIAAATDVGIVLDIHQERIVRHVQVGPMERSQLQSQFLRWARTDLPDRFVFVNLGVETRERRSFDVSWLAEFMDSANRWQQSLVAQIATELGLGEGD